MIINKIIEEVLKGQKISITNHVSPDGDALGSALGLYNVIKALGKDVKVISLDLPPKDFEFLPGFEEIVVTDKDDFIKDSDIVIVLDCGDVKRINANISLEERKYKLINIDHHLSNDNYGDINYVDTNAPAVGEIIYQIIERLKIDLTKDIATCLYTSLLTDTGSFRYSSTSQETHRVAGELIKTGINFTKIHEIIFDNKSFSKIKLYGKVIDTIELELNDKVCFMYLYESDIEELGLENEDTGDVINFGRKINTVEVTVFIKEKEGEYKVSLRSKEKVDVRAIAEIYGGGGHIKAAGFKVNKNLQLLKEELLKNIGKELI